MKNEKDSNFRLISNSMPFSGAIGSVVEDRHKMEIIEMEGDPNKKIFKIRAFISDHVDVCGKVNEILENNFHKMIKLNENPLTIYLPKGKTNVIFFDLVSGENGLLTYIEVRVETVLIDDAFRLATTKINELLDCLLGSRNMPIMISQLGLVSNKGDYIIAYKLILPFNTINSFGPLGGVHQFPLFAPYDALLREATNSNSPYYRFLCFYRLYEGINLLRKKIKEISAKKGISEPLPKDPAVNTKELEGLGFDKTFIEGIRNVSDLFGKYSDQRHAIAHFLFKGDQSHVYLSNGRFIDEYSIHSSLLMKYVSKAYYDLRKHFYDHLSSHLSRGEILPLKEQKDQFIIRDE